MKRLIDANELWGQIYKLSHNHKWKDRTNIAFNRCLDAIQFFPTVDAEPVRHGHWIDHFDDLVPEDSFECSECGALIKQSHDYDGIYHFDHYCKNCGAKMDEVEDAKTD